MEKMYGYECVHGADKFQVWSKRSKEWKLMTVKIGTVIRWYVQDEVNQEESEQDEVDEMKEEANSAGSAT